MFLFTTFLQAGEKFEQVARRSITRKSQTNSVNDYFSESAEASTLNKTAEFLEHIRQEEYEVMFYCLLFPIKIFAEFSFYFQVRQEYTHQNGNSYKQESHDASATSSAFRQVQLSKLLLPHSVKEVTGEFSSN